MSIKLLISPSILNRSLPGRVFLVVIFFFQYFEYILPFPLACRVSAERSAVNCMGFPLYVTSCFSLAVFNTLYLCLISASLISMCFDRFSLGFILYKTHCAPWSWVFPFPCWGSFQLQSPQKLSQCLSFSLLPLGCL